MSAKSNVRNPYHSNFVAAVDDEFINEENIDTRRYLEDSKNMSPHRKAGAMVQGDGHTEVVGFSNLPQPSGFKFIKSYIYALDRDNKEITLLVYEHITTGEIKYYVNPYFNPLSTYSNYNPNKAANSWIAEWLELTECYKDLTLNGNSSGLTFAVDTVPSVSTNDYFNGWFVVNTDIGFNGSRFNFITDYVHSTKTFTCKTNPSWLDNQHVTLVRFPVTYMHQVDVNADNYAVPVDNTFKAKPTDFNGKNNQLRIACGKDLRPLILDCIYKRDYFKGNSAMNYDGLWFDFQQIPQRQKKSYVTGFASQTATGTSTLYIDAATAKFVSSIPTNGIQIDCFSGVMNLGIVHISVPNSSNENVEVVIPGNIGVQNSNTIWFNYAAPSSFMNIPIADAVAALNSTLCPLSQFLSFSVIGTGNITTTSASYPVYTEYQGIVSFSETEAGGNILASNYFLGTEVFVNDAGSGVITHPISRTAFILTCVYDNRNEILAAHGTCRPSTEGTVTTDNNYGFELRFTTWFSRRITQFNIYTRNLNDRNLQYNINSLIKTLTIYPYYAWETRFNNGSNDYVRINELPLFNNYDIYEFDKTKNGERVANIKATADNANGINAYTLKTSEYYWYTKLRDEYNGIKQTGKNVRFLVNANRYIDQDITMNYTKSTFLGQTNGRFFPIGCKNVIEKEPFENDDSVLFNIYASGVSQYDVYLKDRLINSIVGDKDVNQAVSIYGGYLTVIKNSNYFCVDINTDNEVRYRTIESQLGRGTRFPDAVITTNSGIIMPSDDTVYLLRRDQAIPILTKSNGKLSLYRDVLQNGGTVVGSAYYNEFNELILVLQKNSTETTINIVTTYVFFYNFQERTWTYQEYVGSLEGTWDGTPAPNGVVPFQVLTDTSRNVLLLNQFYSSLSNETNFNNYKKFNLIKFDKNAYTFVKPDGATKTIFWNFATHFTAYAGRIFLTKLVWVILNTDVKTVNSNKKININIYRVREDKTTQDPVYELTYKYTGLTKNISFHKKMKDLNEAEMIKIEISNVDEFIYFAIKSVFLEVTAEQQKFENKK